MFSGNKLNSDFVFLEPSPLIRMPCLPWRGSRLYAPAEMREGHWFWECPSILSQLAEPLPPWDVLRKSGEMHNCFWQCSLVPTGWANSLGQRDLDLKVKVFLRSHGPRLKMDLTCAQGCCRAFQLCGATNEWRCVGCLVANLTGKTEAWALLFCLRATCNPLLFVTDAQYVVNRCKRLRRTNVAVCLCPEVWQEVRVLTLEEQRRIDLSDIKSHLSLEAWEDENPPEEAWKWHGNKREDEL